MIFLMIIFKNNFQNFVQNTLRKFLKILPIMLQFALQDDSTF